ncbi:MAG: class I SAM-dependent methyltransferase [Oscillospiraceae bacterium]
MKEIEINKEAWSLISKDHYESFLKQFRDNTFRFNKIILDELGDIKGKRIIHLQCNTGADSIKLAQLGAIVTGVDLVPENIHYAKQMAKDLDVKNADFFESDIMELAEIHHEKYDIVFTSEGAIGWLPDLRKWGKTIKQLLKNDGFFYIFDVHPFYLAMDEQKFSKNQLEIKYPYFSKIPDADNSIGGYASKPREHLNYYWMYTISDVINSLTEVGLHIDFFNEYDQCICDMTDNMFVDDKNLFCNDFCKDRFPMSFSLKARIYHMES